MPSLLHLPPRHITCRRAPLTGQGVPGTRPPTEPTDETRRRVLRSHLCRRSGTSQRREIGVYQPAMTARVLVTVIASLRSPLQAALTMPLLHWPRVIMGGYTERYLRAHLPHPTVRLYVLIPARSTTRTGSLSRQICSVRSVPVLWKDCTSPPSP